MQLKINKQTLEELEKIAKSKQKPLQEIINSGLKEYVMLEKSCEETLKLSGVII